MFTISFHAIWLIRAAEPLQSASTISHLPVLARCTPMKDTAVSHSRTKPAGFDRRAFLKGSGAAAAASALAGSDDAALGLEADGAVVAGEQTITLTVNGKQ